MSRQNISATNLTWKERLEFWLVPRLIYILVQLFAATIRIKVHGFENRDQFTRKSQSWIFCLWHACVLFGIYNIKGVGLAAMVSASRDGEFTARLVEAFGNKTFRGSTSRGGRAALKGILREMKHGTPAALVPDGPRGPAFKVQGGVVMCAQVSGAPIIPFHYEATRQWVLEKSWDKHRIPKPFSTMVVSWGAPIFVPREMTEAEFENMRLHVEAKMMENMRFCQDEVKQILAHKAGARA
ncbi:MAG: lysophospholipid acyltransferase family protein [Spirochaetia bacterium]|nr:lysophospholipid acyltransferase family protein [Spirochaetia bacterium]